MFAMAIAMTFVVAAVELMLFHALQPRNFNPTKYRYAWLRPYWQKLYNIGPWIEAETMHSMAFSIGLSLVLAAMFPVTGIIAFFGGVASTVITQPYYYFLRQARRCRTWYTNKEFHLRWKFSSRSR